MPANLIDLPTDKEALACVVNSHFDRERQAMMPQLTMFRVIWEYLAGARRFDIVDLTTGAVKAYHLDKDGKMEFQSSDLLKAIDQVVGYLSSYDLTCKVTGDGNSLSAIREAAVGQVITDSVFSEQDIQRIVPTYLHIYASLGSCGITAHVDNHIGPIGLTADLEVIHPMELVPFPSIAGDLSKQRGLGRESYVPVERLEERFGKSRIRKNLKNMFAFRVQTGDSPERNIGQAYGSSVFTSEAIGNNGIVQGGQMNTEDEEFTGYVRIREVWLDGPRGTCSRKITVSGRYVLEDLDFTGVEAYRPIGFARFMENGTFHGAGMYHVLWALARNLEKMNKTLFNDVTDRDKYGFLVIPQGSFNVNQAIKPVEGGLKLLPWEVDQYSDAGARPFVVQPQNVGDSATKTAVYAKQYFESLNPLTDIIREKGRVDSERGLSFLQELADKAMTSPTRGLMQSFGQMYRAGLARASSLITQSPTALPVTKLTLDLAGATIDWERNEVKFPENPLPSVSRLKCSPKLAGSKSLAQRSLSGMELVKLGVSTPLKMIIKGIEEGWDLPMWTDLEVGGYQSAIRDILTLYNDGVEPGQLVQNPNYVRPDIQLMILDAFMGTYKMRVASVEVQNEFIAYKEFLIQQNGRTLPSGLPYNLDDVSVASGGQGPAVSAAMPPGMMI